MCGSVFFPPQKKSVIYYYYRDKEGTYSDCSSKQSKYTYILCFWNGVIPMLNLFQSNDLRKMLAEIKKELQQEQEANKLPELKEVLKELKAMYPRLFTI